MTEPESEPQYEPPRKKGRGRRQAPGRRAQERVREATARATAKARAQTERMWHAAPEAMLTILVVAVVVIITLVSYANLVVINDQRVELRGQLDTLKTEETKLMAQYELAYDLQEIETQMLATGQMTKIQNWQTYTLELSEPDAVEYYQGSDLKEKVVSFAKNLGTAIQEYF